MPILQNPWALAALPLILLLFFIWQKRLKREAQFYSDEKRLKPAPRWVRAVAALSAFLFFIGIVAGVGAFARPLGKEEEVSTYEKMRRGCLVPDISGSMAMKVNTPQGEMVKIEIIVEAEKNFVKKRKGDALCITPFETGFRGDLAVPMTTDETMLLAALDEIVKNASGGTSMGDGMFYAFLALLIDTLPPEDSLNVEVLRKEIESFSDEVKEAPAPYLESIYQKTGNLLHTYMIVPTDAETGAGTVNHMKLLKALLRFRVHTYILGVGFDYSQQTRLVQEVRRTGGDVFFGEDPRSVDLLLEKVNKLEKREVLAEVSKRRRELAPDFMLVSAPALSASVGLWFAVVWGPSLLDFLRRLISRKREGR